MVTVGSSSPLTSGICRIAVLSSVLTAISDSLKALRTGEVASFESAQTMTRYAASPEFGCLSMAQESSPGTKTGVAANPNHPHTAYNVGREKIGESTSHAVHEGSISWALNYEQTSVEH